METVKKDELVKALTDLQELITEAEIAERKAHRDNTFSGCGAVHLNVSEELADYIEGVGGKIKRDDYWGNTLMRFGSNGALSEMEILVSGFINAHSNLEFSSKTWLD